MGTEYVVITLGDITRKSEPTCMVFFFFGGGGRGGVTDSIGPLVRKWGIPSRSDLTTR